MWAAHFLFHLSAGWSSAWRALQRGVSDMGWHFPNSHEREAVLPLLGADAMHALQTILLDGGLLLALYLMRAHFSAHGTRAEKQRCACPHRGLQFRSVSTLSGSGFSCSRCKCVGWPRPCRRHESCRIYRVPFSARQPSSDEVRADGGIMRVREAQGPFVVTIFTASELQQDSPADVSVMVQERDSNDAVLDANVSLIFFAASSPVNGRTY